MAKAKERLMISLSESDKIRLDELKVILNQKTYSKVLQQLVRYGKI